MDLKLKDAWCFIKRIFAPSTRPKTAIVKVTAYGWHDNDPPGASIAYPHLGGDDDRYGGKRIHYRAGGNGSYDDPITFAANPKVFPKGTLIYIPRLMKYFVMEDLCGAAVSQKQGEPPIVDIWVGGKAASSREKLIKREEDLTRETETIVVNPPNAFSWDPKPLFED